MGAKKSEKNSANNGYAYQVKINRLMFANRIYMIYLYVRMPIIMIAKESWMMMTR